MAVVKVNPIIVFDFETAGLKCRINPACEIAMLALDGTTLKEVGRYESYFKPYMLPIGPNDELYNQKALDYNQLTLEKLEKEGKELKVVVEEICKWLKSLDFGTTKKPRLCGQNTPFDKGFIQQIFKEAKQDLSKFFDGDTDFYGNFQPDYFDTLSLSHLAYGNDPSIGDFKLGTIAQKVGVALTDGHKAMNDVIATKEILIQYVNRLRNSTTNNSQEAAVRIRKGFHFQF